MKVKVKVPATTANFGPGFDCLGMALPLYNEITVEETVMPGSGVNIQIVNKNNDDGVLFIPTDENNIVYKSIELLYNSIGMTPSELKITIDTNIPLTRGLGSSASVIIGGVMAANRLLGEPADEAAILTIAREVEGHLDNIVPAYAGGFCLSADEDDGNIIYQKLNWSKDWKINICVPDFELATNISRSVLPENYKLKDVTYNLSHLGLLLKACENEDSELLKKALKDKLHEQYREKLVVGLDKIRDKFKNNNDVYGTVLSGAGPSIAVISNNDIVGEVHENVKQIWSDLNIKSQVFTFDIENNGATFVE